MTEDVTVGLIRSVVEHLRKAPEDWASLAVVLDVSRSGVRGALAIAYDADGESVPAAISPSEVDPAVKTYLDSFFGEGDALPVQLLVQFDRASGRYEVTFEDEDPNRWRLTPKTFDTLDETLRPRFD
ncbi:MAG: hypothetical protein ABS63_09620 [Microbacterium sp. SCN 70-27]|nr:hypothetical protein [Microbacterium sp. SCN 70-27]MBN9224555.1 hypothetical protein [Microbacterium sp.]ODT27128.1 MAG: hypothetical protein ABS63_09620 [Microbacterium sp. SCN 70-27]